MQSKDLILLERLKSVEPTAFKELFDLYYKSLSLYSLKYCNSFELAEDIVKELFPISIIAKKINTTYTQ